MTTFGSRLSTCYRVLQKERLLTYGVDSPGQSRGISPLQGGDGKTETDLNGRPLPGGKLLRSNKMEGGMVKTETDLNGRPLSGGKGGTNRLIPLRRSARTC